MFKTVIIALLSALTGHAIATLKKDRVIMELQRDIKRLNSYEHFTSIYRGGFADGKTEGGKRMWIRFMNGERPDSWV